MNDNIWTVILTFTSQSNRVMLVRDFLKGNAAQLHSNSARLSLPHDSVESVSTYLRSKVVCLVVVVFYMF